MEKTYLMSIAISSASKWRDKKKPKDKVLKNSKFLTLYF